MKKKRARQSKKSRIRAKKTKKAGKKHLKQKTRKKNLQKRVQRKRVTIPKTKPLEQRLLEWHEEENDTFQPIVSEQMREKLLKEEFRLRKKQPTAWTKTKYRKYAIFAFNRKKKDKKAETT